MFMFDNTFIQGNTNLFLMLFHSPNWPRSLYQPGCQQETDVMLKDITEDNLIMGLFVKMRHSSSEKIGEPLPAQAWKGQGEKILPIWWEAQM